MTWTSGNDVKDSVLKLWLKGRILAAKVNGEALFPAHFRVNAPSNAELANRFGDAQEWIRALEMESRPTKGFGFDIVWREVLHRQLGRNRVPAQIVIPTEADALKLIGKSADARRFNKIANETKIDFPELLPWLARKSLVAIEHEADWARILAVLAWFRSNPESGLYLRQVDIAQVDTKFIERRRGLLAELLDIVLSRASTNLASGAMSTFEARYGLRSKPTTIRFRLLDPHLAFGGLSDISAPVDEFSYLDLSPRVVFITENEVNGLAFPQIRGGVVLFGLGYSLDVLAKVEWLKQSPLVYWGDIDTHGFAILARLRTYFPDAQSLLMDETTLLNHRPLWVREDRPFAGDLPGLSQAERRLFDSLRSNRFGDRVRLEQERIAYFHLTEALQQLDL